jgi:hypothetical protein
MTANRGKTRRSENSLIQVAKSHRLRIQAVNQVFPLTLTKEQQSENLAWWLTAGRNGKCNENSRHASLRNNYAGLAELADALALGASGRKAVQVQVLCPAPSFPASS